MLCSRVNIADGAVEPTETGFVDHVSPGTYPQFTSHLNMNPKLYFYFHVLFIVLMKE